MGYTHYINHIKPFSDEQWSDIQRFTTALILAAKQSGIAICDGMGEGEPTINNRCIHFNGQGPDSYEDFYLDRTATAPHAFCKTERKPYDAVVVALLIYLNETTDCMQSDSDGEIFGTGDDQWDERTTARELIELAQERAS